MADELETKQAEQEQHAEVEAEAAEAEGAVFAGNEADGNGAYAGHVAFGEDRGPAGHAGFEESGKAEAVGDERIAHEADPASPISAGELASSETDAGVAADATGSPISAGEFNSNITGAADVTDAAEEMQATQADAALEDSATNEAGEAEGPSGTGTTEADAVLEVEAELIDGDIVSADEASEDAPLSPEAVANVAREAAAAGASAAREAAAAGAASVTDGMAAIRAVSAAKRAHAQAKDELNQIEQTAGELADELAHRREVEQNFDDIIELQNKELEQAHQAMEDAAAKAAELEAAHEQAKVALAQLKATNEEKLKAPRELASDARAKLDQAEAEARSARRAVKSAQAQADDAIGSRDSRAQAAIRAVQAAQGKLDRAQNQLSEMRKDPSAGARNLTEKSSEVAGALAQLQNAKAEVARINAEAAQGVEAAQTHLYTQRKSLEMIEDDLAAAMDDEREKRKAFEALKAQADADEKAAADKVRRLASDIDAARQEGELAHGRVDAANAQIAEAKDIHAHPEATDALAGRVAEVNRSAESQRRQVAELASEEQAVRERTQRTRLVFYALVAAAAVIVIVLILLIAQG